MVSVWQEAHSPWQPSLAFAGESAPSNKKANVAINSDFSMVVMTSKSSAPLVAH
jgi:hypothetical protein